MASGQLRLFPAAQPLVERLGEGFFRAVPSRPGVYRMYDELGRLVYVGKAKDLRRRLGSYRRTAGQTRKTIRLVHAVHRVEWDVCESELGARLRENDLIRTLRPRFNRAGTWPASARLIQVKVLEAGFQMKLVDRAEGELYGPYRGGPALAIAAMGTLLWWAWSGTPSTTALPRSRIAWDRRTEVLLQHPEALGWVEDVRVYLDGRGDGLLARLARALPQPVERFDQAYAARQFEALESFYRYGPFRMRRLRERFAVVDGPVTPEQMDDWRIAAGTDRTALPFRPTGPEVSWPEDESDAGSRTRG